ncbi:hypothetical protein [Novosphingobium lentum]|uniref:hypothetical protein n=1 Tax=Novosphingobium lentum TaxID=145287 RepID=UPI000835E34A|nr:hypothetical protein [Novosphingobium lentum]
MFAAIALVWLLSIGSCVLLGAGAGYAVDAASKSELAHRVGKRADEYELKQHNEIANREASVHTRDDYVRDYDQNY